MSDCENYAVSVLNKEKMKLVKSISFWKSRIIEQEQWIENCKKEEPKVIDEDSFASSLEAGVRRLYEYNDILEEERKKLTSINKALTMKHKTIYIIRDHWSFIQGYVDTFEEARLICQKKNAELNLYNESCCTRKWDFQSVYHVPKSLCLDK